MNHLAVSAENLSKSYSIVHNTGKKYKTLQEEIIGILRASLRPGEREQKELFWALRDVSFELNHGEVLGIIGRNGAGKSTLLKILSRITRPTGGRARISGRIGSLLEVGTGFHPELTGRENVFLGGAILGMSRRDIDKRFDEIVAFAEVEQFIDTPAKRYSSGMYMRLAFAVAAHLEPDILIVDEVLAVGDIEFQKKCLGKMENVAQQGRTILFVSHNMAAVRNLCTQAIMLDHGVVVKSGSTEDVIKHYLLTSSSSLSAVIDLPKNEQDAPGRGIRLSFTSSERNLQSQFNLGEPWIIVLEFELFEPLNHVIAAIGVVTFEWTPVITYWSKPKDLPAGKYKVEFACDLPISATDLQFAVGISTYERAIYYQQGLGQVTITPLAINREQPLRSSGVGLMYSAPKSEIQAITT